MNKITTALLGLLLMILGSSCHSTQAVSESDYDLIAILSFDPTVDSTAQPKYLIKNLDGTPFDTLDMNAEYNFFNDGSPKLSGKIVFFFSDQGCYHFFCKKPEEGKPLQILIGDEWKTIEPTPQIKVDSTRHFFTKELVFFPIVDYGQELPIAFYPTPKEDPAKRITLKQDKLNDVKVFFIRDIQGEWMKLQLCVDRSSDGLYENIDSESCDSEFEDWDQLSKVSKDNPTYWIRWRDGSKVLIPQDYLEYRDVEC